MRLGYYCTRNGDCARTGKCFIKNSGSNMLVLSVTSRVQNYCAGLLLALCVLVLLTKDIHCVFVYVSLDMAVYVCKK